MYNGRRRTAPTQVEEQYSDVDEEVNEEVVEQVNVESDVASIPTHVTEENFKGVKEILLNMTWNGTPEEFAQNKAKCTWSFASSMPRHLKHNLSDVNRDVAGDENLHGSLKRTVPLGFEIVSHRSSAPSDSEIKIPGLMPQVISSHGAALWVVPADTPYTYMHNTKVFEPVNFIDEHMLETMQVCTFEDLKEDIQVKAAGKGKAGYGTVAVGTLAHAQLLEFLNAGKWDQHLGEEEIVQILNTPEHRRTIEVPVQVALDLRKELEQPLKDLEKRCIDMEKFQAHLARADGNPHFNSPEGLHGQLVGSDIDPTHKYGSDRLNINCAVNVLARLKYVVLK